MFVCVQYMCVCVRAMSYGSSLGAWVSQRQNVLALPAAPHALPHLGFLTPVRRRAVSQREQVLGRTDECTVSRLLSLVGLLQQQGRLLEAEPLLRMVIPTITCPNHARCYIANDYT